MLAHLEELRTRLFFAIVAMVLGIVVGWIAYPVAYHALAKPLLTSIQAHGGHILTLQPGEAFFTRCKLAVAIGIALASPIVTWQLWAFIKPGLTRRERRVVTPLMPAISVLFLLGAGLAYFMLPKIMEFFMDFVPADVIPNLDFQSSINFPLKVLFAFGLAFQLPVVIIGLVGLRVLTPQLLLRQWRTAIVVIAIIAAVITPTGDPMNWSLLMVPLLLLYFGTVLLAYRLAKTHQHE